MEKTIENRCRGRHVADQLAPIFQRPIAGHDRALGLVPPHDDLEQRFSAPLRQVFHAHVVHDQQIGLQVAGQHLLLAVEGLVVQEVADDIEDRAIENDEALLDRLKTDGLRQEGFPGPRRPYEQHVPCFSDKSAGGQIEDSLPRNRGIETEVELIQRLELSEIGRPHAAFDLSFGADQQFILQDQLQELAVRQVVAGRFLQADIQCLSQA